MNTQESELVKFLGVLDDVGCLRHVVLIGSWAEFLYRQTGILEGFEPNIRTMDIDFLVRNLRRPVPAAQVDDQSQQGTQAQEDVGANAPISRRRSRSATHAAGAYQVDALRADGDSAGSWMPVSIAQVDYPSVVDLLTEG